MVTCKCTYVYTPVHRRWVQPFNVRSILGWSNLLQHTHIKFHAQCTLESPSTPNSLVLCDHIGMLHMLIVCRASLGTHYSMNLSNGQDWDMVHSLCTFLYRHGHGGRQKIVYLLAATSMCLSYLHISQVVNSKHMYT